MSSHTSPNPQPDSDPFQQPDVRRGFLTKAAAIVIGAVAGLVPFIAGLIVFCDPLRRKAMSNGYIRVTSLDSVPDDGMPRQFPVIADMTDAWNRYPNEPIGAVFLRRVKGSKTVEAYHAICPHAGCFVAFNDEQNQFQCPCHNSSFGVDGSRLPNCVSPRDMDTLDIDEEHLQDQEVWVEFKNFAAGIKEKIAK